MTISPTHLSRSVSDDAVRNNMAKVESWIISACQIINQAVSAVDWTVITGTPTTIAGYGITDAAAIGINNDITELAGLTTPLSVAQGGTESATESDARAKLQVPKFTYDSSDPVSGDEGDLWYNATSHTLFVCEGGSTWYMFAGIVKP